MIRSNLKQLVEEKAAAENREISIREVARDIDYRFDSVRMMYNDEMERYPRDLLTKLCVYFGVGISRLLSLADD